MVQPLDALPESPSQTAGPYVHIGCTPNFVGIHGIYDADLALRPFPGASDPITIAGTVRDGTGAVLTDVMLESWQADGSGAFADGAQGFARFAGDHDSGEWELVTVKPGRVRWPDGRLQAPHIALWIVARGINIGLQTRLYFDDEDNDGDPVLSRLDPERARTLLAQRTGDGAYRFDIVVQGDGETVFLDM